MLRKKSTCQNQKNRKKDTFIGKFILLLSPQMKSDCEFRYGLMTAFSHKIMSHNKIPFMDFTVY